MGPLPEDLSARVSSPASGPMSVNVPLSNDKKEEFLDVYRGFEL
jgi:hypothetical protein